MPFFQRLQCLNMPPDLFLRAPNSAEKHDRLMVVLQVAAFVAVDVDEVCHIVTRNCLSEISLLLLPSIDRIIPTYRKINKISNK